MKLGDRVRLLNGESARIVCDFDRREFASDYPEAEWSGTDYTGILVVTDRGALVRLDREDVTPISN
jgi:hypothetical protein